MGTTKVLWDNAWRDTESPEIPGSPEWKPLKSDIRAVGDDVDARFEAVEGLASAGVKWVDPVRAATTVTINLATSAQNGSTIDGVVLATNDRIGVKNQGTGSQNGVYIVQASGAPVRSGDADEPNELVGIGFFVTNGTVNAGKQFVCTTPAPIVVGTTSLTFKEVSNQDALNTNLNAEITRATAREDEIDAALDAEVIRATDAEATELARATAAETALGIRVDKIRSLMLTVTGTEAAFTGTPIPDIGVAPFPDGIELVIKPTFTNEQDATLLGRTMVYPDGTGLYPGAVAKDAYNWFMSLGNTWVLKESGAMDAPVTWFDRSGVWGSIPDEFIPTSLTLKDFIFHNNSSGNFIFAMGGSDPSETNGIVVLPGGTFTADRRLPTPIRAKAAAADSAFTCYFSTTNGRNPVADAGFDALLARNGTTLSAGWDAALRAFYTNILPLLAKCRYLYFFGGPDATLARENWAADNAVLATGSPTRDFKTGYTFNGSSQYIATGFKLVDTVDEVGIGTENFTIGFGAPDTTPAITSGWAVSNYLVQIRESSSSLLTRAHAIGNNSWVPSPRGGFIAMTRRNAADYDSRANSVTQNFTSSSGGTDNFDIAIGCGVNSSGVIDTSLAWSGVQDISFLFKALNSSELDTLQAARTTLLTDIAPL